MGEDWQQRVCQRLGLNYCAPNGVTPGGPEVRLTSPAAFKCIHGDGNCMFRSFSFIITGSEYQHMPVRRAIVQHMRAIGELLWENQIAPLLRHLRSIREVRWEGFVSTDVEWYISASTMEHDRTWGLEVEMMALAHLLDTPVYTYETTHGWNRYNPVKLFHVRCPCMCVMMWTTTALSHQWTRSVLFIAISYQLLLAALLRLMQSSHKL